jgi:hypothetical protein
MYISFAAAVFSTACCKIYVIFRAHPFQWPSLPFQDKKAAKCKNARMGAAVSSL